MFLVSLGWGEESDREILYLLFVLYIERLFHLIQIEVEANKWKPIQIACCAPKLSHLAFANDLLLFAEATNKTTNIISHAIDLFDKS